jgi:hypothetical protein
VDEACQWIIAWQGGWADESQLHWALVDQATAVLVGRVSLNTAIYNRYGSVREMRRALEAWAAELLSDADVGVFGRWRDQFHSLIGTSADDDKITGVKSSSTNSIPTFGPHQRKTHGYKSGLSGYAYPSGISR